MVHGLRGLFYRPYKEAARKTYEKAVSLQPRTIK